MTTQGVSAGSTDANAADTAASQAGAANSMTDTYNQAQLFEAQITQIKVAGDSVLDAVKQRPQI